MQFPKKIKTFGFILILSLSGLYLYRRFSGSAATLEFNMDSIDWSAVSLFFLFMALSWFFFSLSWQWLILSLNNRVSLKEGFEILMLPQLASYIPGSVLSYLGRYYLLQKSVKNHKKSLVLTLGYEAMLFITACLLCCVFVLTPPSWTYGLLVLTALLLSLRLKTISLPGIFSGRKWGIPSFELNIRSLTLALLFTLAGWFTSCIAFNWLLISFTDLSFEQFTLTSITYLGSKIGTMVVLVAPKGLGVQESILTYGFDGHLSPDTLFEFLIFSRVMLLFAEILGGLSALPFWKLGKK